MDEPSAPPARLRRIAVGAAVGLVTALVALGVAELVAGVDRRFASPVTQVGSRVIDAAPTWLKTFAIATFGTNDKPVLIGTVVALLAAFAVVLGVVSRRHPVAATVGAALFGVIGAAASIAGVGGPASSVPSIVGGAVGAAVMWWLALRTWKPSPDVAAASTSATRSDAPGSDVVVSDVVAPTGTLPRRAILGAAAVGAGAMVAGRWLRGRFDAAVERAKVVLPRAKRPLPELDLERFSAGVDGATPFITPNRDFYRIDTALEVPQVALDTWRLKVGGMVDREIEMTFDDLLRRDLVEADVTLTCVSNEVGGQLAGTARWLGVPLRELLDEAGVDSAADQIVGRSVDGYTCGFPVSSLDDDRTALVAVGMNGEPLPIQHGFPARLLVAGLYGYVSATKWLTEIELTTFDRFDQYWVPRGYAARAPIKTFSRVDTPAGLGRIAAGRHPIAGVAWAQTRGISRVEVRVDGGPWADAELRPVPNDETWCQWVLLWDFTPGSHEITCRATDGNGETQTDGRVAPLPDGATGWHSVIALVT